MVRRTAAPAALVLLMIGCSDATSPAGGSFQARLTGTRVAALTGPSNAGSFMDEVSGARFAVRMYAPQGDTIRALNVDCPGETAPAPGSYALSASASECQGHWSKILSTLDGTIVFETLSASTGTLRLSEVNAEQVSGSFHFSGTLVVGGNPAGQMGASGTFVSMLVH